MQALRAKRMQSTPSLDGDYLQSDVQYGIIPKASSVRTDENVNQQPTLWPEHKTCELRT